MYSRAQAAFREDPLGNPVNRGDSSGLPDGKEPAALPLGVGGGFFLLAGFPSQPLGLVDHRQYLAQRRVRSLPLPIPYPKPRRLVGLRGEFYAGQPIVDGALGGGRATDD